MASTVRSSNSKLRPSCSVRPAIGGGGAAFAEWYGRSLNVTRRSALPGLCPGRSVEHGWLLNSPSSTPGRRRYFFFAALWLRGWLERSAGLAELRGALSKCVIFLISARLALPRESRASGCSCAASGFLVLRPVCSDKGTAPGSGLAVGGGVTRRPAGCPGTFFGFAMSPH